MKILPLIAVCIATLILQGQSCNADLILDITGQTGTGVTNWKFSGSDTAGAPEQFNWMFNTGITGEPPLDDSVFAEQGDLFDTNIGTQFVVPPSGATITTPNGTRGIDELYLKENGVTDDIGFAVTGSTDLNFAIGDQVSWTGEFDLNIGLEDLKIGSYSNNYFAFIFFTLDLTVNISEGDTPAIPEPSSLSLLAFGGLLLLRRRRISKA